MARIRTIKPEFWTSEQVVECSMPARLLFIGLWNFADDGGVHPLSPKQIKMRVFPAEDYQSSNVRRMLDELEEIGLIEYYTVENAEYLRVCGWGHQKIDKPNYKHPQPNGKTPKNKEQYLEYQSSNGRRTLTPGREGKGRERKGREGSEKETPDPDSSNGSRPALLSTLASLRFLHNQVHSPRMLPLVDQWGKLGVTAQDLTDVVGALRARNPGNEFGPGYIDKPLRQYMTAKNNGGVERETCDEILAGGPNGKGGAAARNAQFFEVAKTFAAQSLDSGAVCEDASPLRQPLDGPMADPGNPDGGPIGVAKKPGRLHG